MRVARTSPVVLLVPHGPHRREPVPATAACALSGTQREAARNTAATRLAMLALARCFDWQDALVIVKPETFIKWHRTAFRLFWRWKSRRRGRPSLPRNLRDLVRREGSRESNLGRGTNCRRVEAQARHPNLAPHGAKVLGFGPPSQQFRTTLVHLRAESRQGYCRLRLLHIGDRHLPSVVRLRGDGNRLPADSSHQRHGTSNGAMDHPAVP